MPPLFVGRRRAARRGPPRIRELPILGSAVGILRDPLAFLVRIAREHGDAVEFTLPGQRIILFSHPEAIDQMLVTERDRLIKDKLTRELSIVLGRGLLVSEGAFWRKQRKLVQPGFRRERVAAYGDVMADYAERAVSRFRDGEVRDVHEDLMRLTLDIVAKTLLGVEVASVAAQIGSALGTLMDRFSGAGVMVPMSLPTSTNLRSKRAIETLDEIVYGIIRDRRATGDTGDLLSMLIAAIDDEGAMSDRQLRDEVLTLMLAGHETTALTLGFALDQLARHPEAQERLAREVTEVLGDRPASSADLPRLRYTEGVVHESMRLFPPAWAVGREAIAPCTVGGYRIAPGAQLWAAPWVVQRDPRWFTAPLAFRPERWGGDLAKTLPRHAYFPFGGGPRVCIGNAFAMMEAVIVLATIARRYRFDLTDTAPLRLAPSVTLRPKDGIVLRCSARAPSSR